MANNAISLVDRRRAMAAIGLSVSLLLLVLSVAAEARSLVWARASDALSLDPHAVNEGATHAFNHHIYEPLIVRDRSGNLRPALATSWSQTDDPLVWRFYIRRNVKFHDGRPLSADDVIFSLDRARKPTSDMATRLYGVRSFTAVNPFIVEISTNARDPLLPIRLTDIFIMSRSWATQNKMQAPLTVGASAQVLTNGTGPFMLTSRKAGKETRLSRNPVYWGWDENNSPITELIYRPIPSAEKRAAGLLSGDIDFVQDVGINQIGQLRQASGVTLKIGPENRVIFLGLNVSADAGKGSPDQRNPLTDTRVRRAINMTVNRQLIQRQVMAGQSIPTGVVAPPAINGFPSELDIIPKRDLDLARNLMQQAGYTDGFDITFDCPRNRYVNDAAICAAIAAQLRDIGIRAKVVLRDKAKHFQHIRSAKSSLYLLGWGVPTFDSAYIFTNLVHSRQPAIGTWNGTAFADNDLDKMIQGLAGQTDLRKRDIILSSIWQRLNEALIYIPIHVQTLAYAMRDGIDIEVDISNTPKLKNARISEELSQRSNDESVKQQ